MPNIAVAEHQTYDDVWNIIGDQYDLVSPGVEYLPVFLSMVGEARGTLIDAGCGSGRAGAQLAALGFQVLLCDITPDGLSEAAKSLPFVRAVLWQDLCPVAFCCDANYVTKNGIAIPSVDYVFCCDVLEHIPTALTMLTVHRLCRVARKRVFLLVCHQNDINGMWVGHPLHQTVQPFVWWRDHLGEVTKVIEARDLLHHGAFWLEGTAGYEHRIS